MKFYLSIVFVFCSFFCFAQEPTSAISSSKLLFTDSETSARLLATKDIEKGTPYLLLQGGIAPVFIDTDAVFEKKYAIAFYEYGCTGPDYELVKAYNTVIFDYPKKTYGKKWFREVRDDVIGFKEWKKHRKSRSEKK